MRQREEKREKKERPAKGAQVGRYSPPMGKRYCRRAGTPGKGCVGSAAPRRRAGRARHPIANRRSRYGDPIRPARPRGRLPSTSEITPRRPTPWLELRSALDSRSRTRSCVPAAEQSEPGDESERNFLATAWRQAEKTTAS
jgi:hypothetical protein